MKKDSSKPTMIICVVLCVALLFGAVAYAQPRSTQDSSNTIDVEQLSDEVKNSKWFKLGRKEGIYKHITEYPLIGKSYLGESIDGLILMSEEIEGFNLKEFLGSSVCSKYSIEDFKNFKSQGMKTLTDVYEQIYLKQDSNAQTKSLSILESGTGIPSVGSKQWGTVTITGAKMYENSDAPTLVGAFRNANIIDDWYISLFNVTLSGFSGDFAWLNGKSFNSVGNSSLLSGSVNNYIRCLSPKKAAPSATMSTSIEARISKLDENSDTISVVLTSSSFGSGYQAVGGPITFSFTFPEPPPKDGYVKIQKSSSKPELTTGNTAYNIQGAKFSIYSADREFTWNELMGFVNGETSNTLGFKWYGNFITLSNGTAREQAFVDDGFTYIDNPTIGSMLAKKENGKDYYWYYYKNNKIINLPVGNYQLTEEFVPEFYGYTLSKVTKSFVITEGHTETAPLAVNFTNTPYLDPIDVLLQKLDSETGQAKPQGSGSLAGAEFRVCYFPVLTENIEDLAYLTPTYIMTAVTDERGYGIISDDQLPFVEYPDGSIRHGLPYGTITIQETKAPKGYLISSGIYLVKISPPTGKTAGGALTV